MKPKTIPKSKLEPSIWALQLKLKSPVFEVDSELRITSPKTLLSQAPWMSRGQTRGTAVFWGQRPVCDLEPHILAYIDTYSETAPLLRSVATNRNKIPQMKVSTRLAELVLES